MSFRNIALGLTLCTGLCIAQVADISGTWKLNIRKSNWGRKQKPASIMIHIDHHEPALVYSGTVIDLLGDGRQFEFKGVLDGKEYAMDHSSYGAGKIAFKRIDRNTTLSVFRSNDALVVEEARTTLASDGKQLVHSIVLKDPGGTMTWTEVYDKQ